MDFTAVLPIHILIILFLSPNIVKSLSYYPSRDDQSDIDSEEMTNKMDNNEKNEHTFTNDDLSFQKQAAIIRINGENERTYNQEGIRYNLDSENGDINPDAIQFNNPLRLEKSERNMDYNQENSNQVQETKSSEEETDRQKKEPSAEEYSEKRSMAEAENIEENFQKLLASSQHIFDNLDENKKRLFVPYYVKQKKRKVIHCRYPWQKCPLPTLLISGIGYVVTQVDSKGKTEPLTALPW